MDRSRFRRFTAAGAAALAVTCVAGCGGGLPVSAAPSSTTTAPPTGGAPPPASPPSTIAPPSTTSPGAAPTTTLPPLAHATAGAPLLRMALVDAASEHWMHARSTSTAQVAGGATTLSDNVDGPGRGTQEITVGPVSGSIRVLGAATYIEGSPEALVDLFAVPEGVASRLGGRWVALRAGDSNYATVTVGVTMASFLQQIAFTGPVTAGTSTLAGAPTRVLEGRLAPSVGAGSGVLYLTGGTRPRPLLWEQVGSGGTTRTTFGDWGQAATVTAPPGAVTLPSSAGTTGPVAAIRPIPGRTARRQTAPS